jgi:hypothetical protein
MKHLLNDLSNEEKNRIREQYEGGMSIDNSKFKKLVETKLGDAKPLVMEESEEVDINSLMGEEGMSAQDINSFCSPTTPPPFVQKILDRIPENIKEEAKTVIKNFANAIKNFSIKDLLSLRRKLQEQLAPIMIAGIAISPSLLIAVGAILLFIIIFIIVSKSGKKGGGCNPGWWDNL